MCNEMALTKSALLPGGKDLGEAMANAGLAMFNYMTPLSGIEIDPSCSRQVPEALLNLCNVEPNI